MTNENNSFAPNATMTRPGRPDAYPMTPLTRQRGAIGIFTASAVAVAVAKADENSLPQQQTATSNLSDSLPNRLTGLADSLVLNVHVLGIGLSVGGILAPLVSIVSRPIFNALGSLLDPLLHILGIRLGTPDIELRDLDLSRPVLVI
ncbi:MAG: hypothetical protein ACRESZ_12330 [Methylococcales bacterium]